jgi:hypothetical protein
MELLRPTAPAPSVDVEQADEAEGQGGLPDPQSSPKRRRGKTASTGKTRARNIRLSDDVHDRLWQLAHQRRSTVSAVADELLNKALPRWEVKRQG